MQYAVSPRVKADVADRFHQPVVLSPVSYMCVIKLPAWKRRVNVRNSVVMKMDAGESMTALARHAPRDRHPLLVVPNETARYPPSGT